MNGALEAIRTPNLRLRRATLYPIELRMQNVCGWGTWIRTRVARSRAGSSTAKLFPKKRYVIHTALSLVYIKIKCLVMLENHLNY